MHEIDSLDCLREGMIILLKHSLCPSVVTAIKSLSLILKTNRSNSTLHLESPLKMLLSPAMTSSHRFLSSNLNFFIAYI